MLWIWNRTLKYVSEAIKFFAVFSLVFNSYRYIMRCSFSTSEIREAPEFWKTIAITSARYCIQGWFIYLEKVTALWYFQHAVNFFTYLHLGKELFVDNTIAVTVGMKFKLFIHPSPAETCTVFMNCWAAICISVKLVDVALVQRIGRFINRTAVEFHYES